MSYTCIRGALAAALLAGGLALAGCGQGGEQAGGSQTYEGVHVFEGQVSDSTCGAMHKMPDAKACTEACVNGGDSYVLVIGDVVHPLQGNNEEIKQFAGAPAQVSASLEGNALKVVRISAPGQRQPTEG
jgi:hypothetical protein